MLQGTPQDQIPTPPPLDSLDSPTAIPIQAVDADQLPREKGWTYDEIAAIVGSLYLDSHHNMKLREEQFAAVTEEYEKRMAQLHGEIQGNVNERESLIRQVATLRREVEIRNGQRTESRPIAPPGNGGDDQVSDN